MLDGIITCVTEIDMSAIRTIHTAVMRIDMISGTITATSFSVITVSTTTTHATYTFPYPEKTGLQRPVSQQPCEAKRGEYRRNLKLIIMATTCWLVFNAGRFLAHMFEPFGNATEAVSKGQRLEGEVDEVIFKVTSSRPSP